MSDEQEQPSQRLQPPTDEIADIQWTLAADDYDAALEMAEEAEGETPLEADWVDYLTGLTLLAKGELDDAYEKFDSTAQRIASASSDECDGERFRLAAKCLKKAGWYHRNNQDYHRAYGLHSMEHQLVEEYGSPVELHDACLSLDVDCFYLGYPQMSRMWLERCIDAAESINDETTRIKALGMSWNNLVGTLCTLHDYEEAVDAAETSLDYWSEYEDSEGTAENRVVWAHHILGDAYKRWGDSLVADEEAGDGVEKLSHAQEALEEALDLAEEREMSADERADIEEKLDAVNAGLAAVGGVGAEESEADDEDDDSTGDGEDDAEESGNEASEAVEEAT